MQFPLPRIMLMAGYQGYNIQEPLLHMRAGSDMVGVFLHRSPHRAQRDQMLAAQQQRELAVVQDFGGAEAGNIHDSQAFPVLFAKLEPFSPEFIIADSGYKTPSIAKFLLEKEITPVFPYTRPRVREAFYVLKTLSMTSILTAIFVQRTRY